MQRSGFIKIIPLICAPAVWARVLWVHLSVLRMRPEEWLQWPMAGCWHHISTLSSLRAHLWSSCNGRARWPRHPFFTGMADNSFFHSQEQSEVINLDGGVGGPGTHFHPWIHQKYIYRKNNTSTRQTFSLKLTVNWQKASCTTKAIRKTTEDWARREKMTSGKGLCLWEGS